jgi:hypothetical protein
MKIRSYFLKWEFVVFFYFIAFNNYFKLNYQNFLGALCALVI